MNRLFSRLRVANVALWFQLLTCTVAIVGLLMAAKFLSMKPSLDIRANYSHGLFDPTLFRTFYQDNKLHIPEVFNKNASLRRLFVAEPRLSENHKDIVGGMSEYELITAIKARQSIGTFLDYRIGKLEGQLEKYTYDRHLFVWASGERFRVQDMKDLSSALKSELSREDYYILLCALIYSRTIGNTIFITNNGDIDLEQLKITIPAPLSRITNKRNNNILNTRVTSTMLHNIEQFADRVEIYIPRLSEGRAMSLTIDSRENQIERASIFYSFKEVRVINKTRMWRSLGVVFCILLVLMLVGKREKQSRTSMYQVSRGLTKDILQADTENHSITAGTLTNRNRVILQGAVYPAIQACTNNRYRIVLGIFAYYAFVVTAPGLFRPLMIEHYYINPLASVIFTMFVLHNGYNYWQNGKRQAELEATTLAIPKVEMFFQIVVWTLIWGACYLFSKIEPIM